MTDADTGIGLDQSFDFMVDSTGDLDVFVDVDEMHKDLSGILTLLVDEQATGVVPTPNQMLALETRSEAVLQQDPRVTAVRDVTVTRSDDRSGPDMAVELDSIYGATSFTV